MISIKPKNPLRENRHLVMLRIGLLHEHGEEVFQELADDFPTTIVYDHGTADIDGGPFGRVDGGRGLDGANTDASQNFGAGPVRPIAGYSLEHKGLGGKEVRAWALV